MSYLSTFSRPFGALRDQRDAEDVLSGMAARDARHDWLTSGDFAIGALSCTIGDVTFLKTHTLALTVRKSGLPADLIGVARVNAGGCRIRFGGDTLDVEAGDTFSFAAEQDLYCESPVHLDKTLILMPRRRFRQLGLDEELIRSRSAHISGDGMAEILFEHFDAVARRLHHGPSLSQKGLASISRSVVQMTAALLEENTATVTGETRLVAAAKAYVDDHLLDPALTPATIAAALFVSLRTLYRSFADSDDSLAEYIRNARLLQAKRELALAGGSADIRLVAQRWGFATPSHFSKLFSQRFGCPPSEYVRDA